MKHGRIEIKKRKVGTFRPRTVYDLFVDDSYVGEYSTVREANRVADQRCKYNDEQEAILNEDIKQEFDL